MSLIYPVPRHPDGRSPKISSGFQSSDRPTHNGVDIMYRRAPTDGGPPGKTMLPSHSPRHTMPAGVPALSIGPGVVRISEELKTGGYVVIDHPGGLTSQYMHLFNRRVVPKQAVSAAAVIGDIGFNPGAYRLLHLHFQLRQDGELLDPRAALRSMRVIASPTRSGLWIGAAAAVAAGLAAAKYVFA